MPAPSTCQHAPGSATSAHCTLESQVEAQQQQQPQGLRTARRRSAHTVTAITTAIATGLALVACADSATAPTRLRDSLDTPSATTTSSGVLTAAQRANADLVARAIARAMSRADARALTRDAMRASDLTEHKLDLAEFARSTAGRTVLAAGAPLAGTTADAVLAAAAALPAIDFYMPSADDRRTWRASANVGVVVIDGGGAQRVAALPDGSTQAVDLTSPTQARPLFALTPAEPKSRRVGAQPAGRSGDVIQDTDDGQVSGRRGLRTPDGDSVSVELADPDGPRKLALFAARHGLSPLAVGAPSQLVGGPKTPHLIPCGEPGADPSCEWTPPPPPKDTTFLHTIRTQRFCDNANCAEGNEFQFFASYSAYLGGPELASGYLEVYGVGSSVLVTVEKPVIFARPHTSSDYVKVSVKEWDVSWINPDDHVGNPAYAQVRHNYRVSPFEFDHISDSWASTLVVGSGSDQYASEGKMYTSFDWTPVP